MTCKLHGCTSNTKRPISDLGVSEFREFPDADDAMSIVFVLNRVALILPVAQIRLSEREIIEAHLMSQKPWHLGVTTNAAQVAAVALLASGPGVHIVVCTSPTNVRRDRK